MADEPGRTLTALAGSLGAPKSSVSNLCAVLVDAELLARRPDGGYGLGPGVLDLANAYLRHTDLVRAFNEEQGHLPEGFGETLQLARRDGDEVIYLARREGIHRVQLVSEIGLRLPASCTGTGKALLAELDDDAVRATVSEPLPRLTGRSHRTVKNLLADLAEIRERGFAVDRGETTETMVCVAATVGQMGQPVARAAVSISFVGERATPGMVEEVAGWLRAFTGRLTRVLGGDVDG